jgi:hypothetical protein
MNDLPSEISDTELDMYADDSTLGATADTLELVEQKLNSDLSKVVVWCRNNKMVINFDKPNAMLLTTYQKLHTLPVKEISVKMNDTKLDTVKKEKLLGMSVDQHLTWKDHVDKVHKTISMVLACFCQIKPFLPTEACIKYCQAFIFPHFDYCSTVWGSTNIERLYKLQKRTARMIFDLPTQTPTKPLLEKLKWMSIMDRVSYRKAVMVYKSLNGLVPSYMRKLFKLVKDVSTRSTRHVDNTKLYLQSGNNLKKYTDNFSYSAAITWNNIPAEIREASSINAFKGAYVKWFLKEN